MDKPRTSTTEIMLRRALQENCGEECVDWAMGLLEAGQDSDYVLRLATQLPPHNHFEICSLRDRAIDELRLSHKSLDELAAAYSCELLCSVINNDSELPGAVAKIADLCIGCGYMKSIYDFYLLYEAYRDLMTLDDQWYWHGATRTNIIAIMREQAQLFLERHS
jgi:hypothetical protein